VAQTQQERKAETRDRLLAAAADLFAAQGIDAVSVDAVAEAAGRTSGAVYAHFGSKQGLLLALLDEGKRSVLTGLSAEVAETDDPGRQVAAVWTNVGAGEEGGGVDWTLLEHELWLRAVRDPEVASVLRERNAEALGRSARELARWTSDIGATPPVAPPQLAVLVKALLNGLELQQRLDPGSVPTSTAVRGLSALLGLDPDATAPADGARTPARSTTQR
jgi:AcrR family transcriptional regulator